MVGLAKAAGKRSIGAFALVAFALVIACSTSASPTPPKSTSSPPSATREATATPIEAPTETTSRPSPGPEPDLGAVPKVALSKHSVPLQDVVFDTFTGGFVRLLAASSRTIESLRDAIRPIYQPEYGDADGLPWLQEADLVLGYTSGLQAFAYPILLLNFRELVNDVIDGEPVLVSYCPLCGSGAVYSRKLEGRTLLFGNTSALYESDLVMYDHQTGSYWFQVLGEAIVGELIGERLTLLASMTTTWGRWKELHPDTRLLVSDGATQFAGLSGRVTQDPFSGYADEVNAGRYAFPVSEESLDGRLLAGELVITVELNSEAKAYPLSLLVDAPINDVVSGRPVVIFPSTLGAGAYIATAAGKEFTFQAEDGTFVDAATRSTWDAGGRAVAGPLEGSQLEGTPSRRAFWFSVALALPGIEIYTN